MKYFEKIEALIFSMIDRFLEIVPQVFAWCVVVVIMYHLLKTYTKW
jgi:hypothetical protein